MRKSIGILLSLLPLGTMAQQVKDKPGKTENITAPKPPQERIFRTVEQLPEFPGGSQALQAYFKQRLHYPPAALKMNIEGQVVLQFVVDQAGKISDIRIMKDIGGGCGREAVRLVEAMPQWRPAKQSGHPVSCIYSLPVAFHKDKVDTAGIK